MMKNSKNKKRMYMIVLSGQGDTYIKLINKETWDWIFSSPPKFIKGMAVDKFVPEYQIQVRKKEGLDEIVRVTQGSYINDRALEAVSDDGFEVFYSLKEAIKMINKNKIKIIQDWQGHVY